MRHRIFSEPPAAGYPRVWRVQLAGHDRPVNEGALTWAGALELLHSRLAVNEWWADQDPLNETPRPTSFTRLREPRSSLWDYLASPFRGRP